METRGSRQALTSEAGFGLWVFHSAVWPHTTVQLLRTFVSPPGEQTPVFTALLSGRLNVTMPRGRLAQRRALCALTYMQSGVRWCTLPILPLGRSRQEDHFEFQARLKSEIPVSKTNQTNEQKVLKAINSLRLPSRALAR